MTLDRPKKVTWAVNLLYASLGIGVIRIILASIQMLKPESLFVPVVLVALGSCFLWLIIYKTNKGKNWARWTCLVIFILPLLCIRPTFLLLLLMTQPVLTAIALTQAVIHLIAIIFLFQTGSSEWYKQMKLKPNQIARPDL
jgi:hypothetical protein